MMLDPNVGAWEAPNDSYKIRRNIADLAEQYESHVEAGRQPPEDLERDLAETISVYAYEGGSTHVVHNGVVYWPIMNIGDPMTLTPAEDPRPLLLGRHAPGDDIDDETVEQILSSSPDGLIDSPPHLAN